MFCDINHNYYKTFLLFNVYRRMILSPYIVEIGFHCMLTNICMSIFITWEKPLRLKGHIIEN